MYVIAVILVVNFDDVKSLFGSTFGTEVVM
jgi:hypothetical protein